MKKLLALLTVLAALSVTACGPETTDDTEPAAATPSTEAEALCRPGPSNPSCCEFCPSVAWCTEPTGNRISVRSSCSSWDSMRMCNSLIASGRCVSCTMGGSMGNCHKK